MTKIFCIGAHKTGTSSLGQAFSKMGFKVIPQPSENPLLYKNYSMLDLAEKYEVFQDSPWNHGDNYKKLFKEYPDAYFILTYRDPQEWADSYERFIQTFGGWSRFPKADFLKCYGAPGISTNRDIWISNYMKRNEEINTFFAGNNKFMAIKTGDLSWSALCDFVGCENKYTTINFPHINRTRF